MRGWLVAALAALAVIGGCDDTETHLKRTDGQAQSLPTAEVSPAVPAAQPFDFYVLALSWSPSYCEAEGSGANQQQCGAKRPYAFVVHGLWPQYERGFPTDCQTEVARVPDDLVRSLYDIMPSAGLIGHQWRRHGSCSGLGMEDYFATLRMAREKVAIPPDYRGVAKLLTVDPKAVEAKFLQANQGLAAKAISVNCDRRYLKEIRLCLTKTLEFRSCPELERRTCKAATVQMPPVRGG